jgi:hypothetical protein
MKYDLTVSKIGATAFTWKVVCADGREYSSRSEGRFDVYASFDAAVDAACDCVAVKTAFARA